MKEPRSTMIQCVILKPRAFSSGAKDLARTTYEVGQP